MNHNRNEETVNPLSDASAPLEVAQTDHRRKKAEVARLWAAFSEKKQAVEAAGGVVVIERCCYHCGEPLEPHRRRNTVYCNPACLMRARRRLEAGIAPDAYAAGSAGRRGRLRLTEETRAERRLRLLAMTGHRR